MAAHIKILVGLIFTLLTCVPLAAVAINDMGMPGAGTAQPSGMQVRAADRAGRRIEAGADLFEAYCMTCHSSQGEGLPAVAPAVNRQDLFDGRRTRSIGWLASLEGFLKNTISAGRPAPSRPDLYATHMPTWSKEYGGPLRSDQIDALVAFVRNWADQAPEVDAWPARGAGAPQPGPMPGPGPMPAVGPTPVPTQ